jgi:hypothetical protein
LPKTSWTPPLDFQTVYICKQTFEQPTILIRKKRKEKKTPKLNNNIKGHQHNLYTKLTYPDVASQEMDEK